MYDAGKVIPGLVIFGILITFPVWYNAATGKAHYVPVPQLTVAGQCIEPAQEMIDDHMKILEQWRQLAVRDDVYTYVGSDGKTYEISLTGTCLQCHSKQEFCDQCHNYAGVSLSCWECHSVPQNGVTNAAK